MRVLVDTCVWSCALRRRGGLDAGEAVAVKELRDLVEDGDVAIIGPIRQEVLSGIRHLEQFERLRERLCVFQDVRVETQDYERAAEMFNFCRGQGIQGSNTDFLICAVAERHAFSILTLDQDFLSYARVLPVLLHPRQEG